MDLLYYENAGKTSESTKRRKINIDFINSLPLDGLSYSKEERLLHLYTTSSGEKLFLQYPGKESIREKNQNLRDFRPKVLSSENLRDLSFGDVWATFFDTLKSNAVTDASYTRAIDYLILLLFKSAYLINFDIVKNPQLETYKLRDNVLIEKKPLKYTYPILLFPTKSHSTIFEYIQRALGNLCEMSVEAFVLYNDILAWNEDCKYYNRGIAKGKSWSNGTGKPNTLLTHISVLAYIRGELGLSTVLSRFIRTRGVSVPTKKEIVKLLGEYINPAIKDL